MADITNAQIILWDNARTRPLADKMAAIYADMVAYQNDYAAQGIAAAITAAGATNNIGDGYVTDGRAPVTGTQIINFKACVDQIKTSFDTNVTGVGTPVTTTVNQIQVNGSPR